MTDRELAEQLFAAVRPDGFGIRSAMAAGEDVAAIIDLVEQAALRTVRLPQTLLDSVAEFVDDPALDGDDVAAVREDLATLAPFALTA
ncbi:hypothetical protein KIH27_20835 [Mycobacterium sp. M1]|uniref:Uncharacterized protein n=1 Tax=Mycolicibacter acidiphilus TaxID=2835306 RepID=A0ABS5RR55_9MYCO|nr:hypothetical protein [Mycolicibacter acidiphilus]MBS9536033.1 hypothetical protein [Mycolicibacter acidiphilus]